MPQARQGGVRLRGTIKGPTGDVDLRPVTGGVFEGVIYGRSPIALNIDPATGRFEVVLPPSSAVGTYRLRVGRQTFYFDLPDGPACELDKLLAKVEE